VAPRVKAIVRREQKEKNRSRRTLGAELHSARLARRLTVGIDDKINRTASGAEPGAGTSGHFGFPPLGGEL